MPLRWDPLLVRQLARELDGRLAGTRTRALRLDGAGRDLTLLLKDATLAWSLHPDGGAPRLLPPAEPAPRDLPLPGRIRQVRSLEDERILLLEILPARGRRGRGGRDLVVELLGNQWNALVVERPSGTLRHVLVRRDGPRPARVGSPYLPPPPSPREGSAAPLSQERWLELLETVPPPQRRRELVSSVAWTSPVNAKALLDGDPDPVTALRTGYGLWRRMAFGDEPLRPVVLRTPKGLQPYPWPLPGLEAQPTATLLEAFQRAAAEGEAPEPSGGAEAVLPPDLVSRLEATVDSQLRRVTRLQSELDGLEDEAALRARGDLLLARFALVPPGAASVTLPDFQGVETTVSLDPSLTVQENASALYDRAAKAARARRRLPPLLAEAATRGQTLSQLLEGVRRGTVEAQEVRQALPEAAAPSSRESGPSLPYRVFRSSGGLEIRVGRGAKHNDALTFRNSAPSDIWLHARHTAGAHVILRWNQPGSPPKKDLHEAAALAALHSKARTSGSVPVDWTPRKYVRKPRGSAPGAVMPQRVKTVMVRPDPVLLERLAEE